QDILFSAQLALSWAFFFAVAFPAARVGAEVFRFRFNFCFGWSHILFGLSIQPVNGLARKMALGSCVDGYSQALGVALSSIWSVHFADVKAPVNLQFFQLNLKLY